MANEMSDEVHVILTRAELKALQADIATAHYDRCSSMDNCDCDERIARLRAFESAEIPFTGPDGTDRGYSLMP